MNDEKKTFGQLAADKMISSKEYPDKWIESVRAEYADIIDGLYDEKISQFRSLCEQMEGRAQYLQLSSMATGDAGATVEAATLMLARSYILLILDGKNTLPEMG